MSAIGASAYKIALHQYLIDCTVSPHLDPLDGGRMENIADKNMDLALLDEDSAFFES
ncbi:hypothetical protein H2203_006727 [Taxawa tesnikishii (nom. ined.)]|nr:hypothetical protein H2203_006727 [Dothideales sp. JES 119]